MPDAHGNFKGISLAGLRLPWCGVCKGKKEIEGIWATYEGHPVHVIVCPNCNGTGLEPEKVE